MIVFNPNVFIRIWRETEAVDTEETSAVFISSIWKMLGFSASREQRELDVVLRELHIMMLDISVPTAEKLPPISR